jgi:hypothetical protein
MISIAALIAAACLATFASQNAARSKEAGAEPRALGARIFEPRLNDAGDDQNGLRAIRAGYIAGGGFRSI